MVITSTEDPNAFPFAEGDIIRTQDPDFEMIYLKPGSGTPGKAVFADATGEADLATPSGPQGSSKISVMTSFVDRETGNVGVLQRGYIVQTATVTLKIGTLVKPDANGDPITGTRLVDDDVYGVVIGKANTNDQTTRSDAVDTELVIIKVGDY